MQSTARKQELPLDKMCLITDVTNITCRDALANPPKEGVYVHGLYMEVIEYSSKMDKRFLTEIYRRTGSQMGLTGQHH